MRATMVEKRTIKMHPTGRCPKDQELQINAMTMEQVCALPRSTPHYLADSGAWVMVPDFWVLVNDRGTGRLRWEQPPNPKPLNLTGQG